MWMKTSPRTEISTPRPGRRKRWASKWEGLQKEYQNMVEGQLRVKFRNRVSGSASNSWDGPDGIVVAHPFIIHIRMGTMDERPYGFWLNQIKGSIAQRKSTCLLHHPSICWQIYIESGHVMVLLLYSHDQTRTFLTGTTPLTYFFNSCVSCFQFLKLHIFAVTFGHVAYLHWRRSNCCFF